MKRKKEGGGDAQRVTQNGGAPVLTSRFLCLTPYSFKTLL